MASLFNDLGKKLTQTSQEAVKKAKELAEIAKLNSSISDEQRNINKYFSQIGEKYLELYGDTTEEPFASYCESIRASKMKIKDLEKEIKLIRNIKVCTNCGAEFSNNAVFCSFCGHKQEVEDVDVEIIIEPVEDVNDDNEAMNDDNEVMNDDNEVTNEPNETVTVTVDIDNETTDTVTQIIDEEKEGSNI